MTRDGIEPPTLTDDGSGIFQILGLQCCVDARLNIHLPTGGLMDHTTCFVVSSTV